MIHSVAFEFETEHDMLNTANKLWDDVGITGEMEMQETTSGRWRLSVFSEKQIKEAVLEKVNGKRVQAKSSLAPAIIRESPDDNDD